MKWWPLFLTLYVLVLSELPCEAFCPDKQKATREQASRPASDDHAHDADCSPFCLCATCPGFALPQTPQLMYSTVSAALPMAAPMSLYCLLHPIDVPDRIWQPPRVG